MGGGRPATTGCSAATAPTSLFGDAGNDTNARLVSATTASAAWAGNDSLNGEAGNDRITGAAMAGTS